MKTQAYRPGEVLVRLKSASEPPRLMQGSQILDRYPLEADAGPILHVGLPPGQSVEAALAELADDPQVAYAVPNHLLYPLEVDAPALDERLYGLRQIQAPQAWKIQQGSRQGPLLAVIDTGIDTSHPELKANLWSNPGEIPDNQVDDDGNGVVDDVHGFDASTGSGQLRDPSGHGTHVAGTIAGARTGVVPLAQIAGCRFIVDGLGDTAHAIAALRYADSIGARITNNSWGGSVFNQALYDTLKASPALHVCAAGNDGANNDVNPVYPASYDLPNIVSVGAVDEQHQLCKFSNYGAESVDLVAPGQAIFSTVPGGGWGTKSGTSMASPHVAGTALLIANQYPQLNNQQIKDRLIFGSERRPHLEGRLVNGGGHLNALASLRQDQCPPAAVGQLQVEAGLSPFRLPLSWLAPGDDGNRGQAAAYELALASHPFSPEQFAELPKLAVPVPAAAGQKEAWNVDLLPSGQVRTLHLGLRAVDHVGLRGPLQILEVEVPSAQVALSDADAWQAEGDWGRLHIPGRGWVWADSPQGPYRPKQETCLTSPPMDLSRFERPRLSFECRHDLEPTFDKVFLEVSPNGRDWNQLASYNRRQGWYPQSFDLSGWQGPETAIRFRLKTDADVEQDGFFMDRLVVYEER